MDNSLLISLSHQIATYRSMDVIANNLANASTPAFQREEPTFQEYVAHVPAAEGQAGATQSLSFVQDAGVVRDLSEGHLNGTNAPFDFAIHGKGYFAVQTPQGERYTRNGHFSLDASGQLVTSNGDAVQGDGGAITITPDDGEVHIAQDGTISGKNGQIGRLKVVDFANPRLLKKEGASLYDAAGQAPSTAVGASIQAGMLETSNVEPVVEITHMIEVMRAYQATAMLTQSHEDLMRQAIDKLGSLRS
ncbi:MAG: flagellar basal-body rod protein FlgF [Alphaproteobacteria bacterium]|nr:flagellar basal-body rod protein FlgF [Alphaproteobacteria bacterium]